MRPVTDPAPRMYCGIAVQREAILARLRVGPATVRDLEMLPGVRDATARVHELRAAGHNIETRMTDEVNADGSFNTVGLYGLHEGPNPQGDLFGDS